MRMVTLTAKIPKDIDERIEKLVREGFYASKSHLIRRAVIDYLERNHPERKKILS